MMVSLPVPPSANNLFINVMGRGRVVSGQYQAWRTLAGTKLNAAKVVPFGKQSVQVAIFIPVKTRGDIDNRVKGVLDLLVRHRVIDDDKQVKRLSIEYHEDKEALVTILPFEQRSAA